MCRGLRGQSWAWICSRYTVHTNEIAQEQEKEVIFVLRKAKGILRKWRGGGERNEPHKTQQVMFTSS